MTDDDLYDDLRARADVREIDATAIVDGMRVIGNRETVRSLADDLVQSLIAGETPSDHAPAAIADRVLAKALRVQAFHPTLGDHVQLLDLDGSIATLTLPYGDPVLIWTDDPPLDPHR